jgi:beta-alanine degradation protein BauB
MKARQMALIGVTLSFGCVAAVVADPLPSSNLPVTGLKFFDTGIGPLKAAPAHGDMQKGPHGTYVKMPAGWVSPPHTHTDDYWAVVVSGVGANGAPGATDVPLPAGSYWAQRGKEVHVTKCLSAVECIFFVSQSSKFDYVNTK